MSWVAHFVFIVVIVVMTMIMITAVIPIPPNLDCETWSADCDAIIWLMVTAMPLIVVCIAIIVVFSNVTVRDRDISRSEPWHPEPEERVYGY